MVWYGTVWYGMLWYGMVRYGMVWYATVGMVWPSTLLPTQPMAATTSSIIVISRLLTVNYQHLALYTKKHYSPHYQHSTYDIKYGRHIQDDDYIQDGCQIQEDFQIDKL